MPWLLLSLFLIQAPASGLRARVQKIIDASGADVAVVMRSVDGKDELLIDPDKNFHAASTMKVPVMIELYRQAEVGQLKLDDPLPIRNEFHSIVDGSVYQLSVGDDSDAEVYKAIGKTMTLRELCEAMITVSSNFAANLLIERVGAENVRKTVSRLGADGMVVLRGVEDQKAFDKGLNNATTARALAVLMQKLAQGQSGQREGGRGDGGDPRAPEVPRRDPVGCPGRHGRRAQDRQHHQDSSRRRDRLRAASLRPRRPRARHPGSEGQRPADGVDLARDLERPFEVAEPFR